MEERGRRPKRGLAEQNKKLARERALVILQVCSGALTAKEGARLLGVSRKTYYEWEEKSLKAMALALENRPSGRPPLPLDPEKEALRERVRELEKKLDLAEKTLEVKDLLAAYEGFRGGGSKKTARSARSDKEGCGDCRGDEETDGDALRDHLQDASVALGEP